MRAFIFLLLIIVGFFSSSLKAQKKANDLSATKAEYPGGDKARSAFIKEHLVYPAFYKKHNINYSAQVDCTIDSTGRITDISCARDGYHLHVLDSVAMRLITAMPRWQPAQRGGISIDSKVNIPVSFRDVGVHAQVRSKVTVTGAPQGPSIPRDALANYREQFANHLDHVEKKDSFIHTGPVSFEFSIDSTDQLIYIHFTKPGNADEDSVILFALDRMLDQKRTKKPAYAFNARHFNARDIFHVEIEFTVPAYIDDRKYIAEFLSAKGNYNIHRERKEVPVHSVLTHRDVLPKDPHKILSREYRIEINGGSISKMIREYNTDSFPSRSRYWNQLGELIITEYNYSTGKSLTLNYALQEGYFEIDTADMRSEKTPVGGELISITELDFSDGNGTGVQRNIFPEPEKDNSSTIGSKTFYNRDGYPDSIYTARSGRSGLNAGEPTVVRFTYRPDHKLLSSKSISTMKLIDNVTEVTTYLPTYDAKGNLIAEKEITETDMQSTEHPDDKVHATKTIATAAHTYDAQGRKVSEIVYERRENHGGTDTISTAYTYPSPRVFIVTTQDGRWVTATENHLGQYGRRVRIETYDPAGKGPHHITKIDYE